MRCFGLNLFVVAGLMLGFGASTAFAQCELDKLTASGAGKGMPREGTYVVAWVTCL